MAAVGAAGAGWEAGSFCEALWEDGNWYPAQVLEATDPQNDVYLVLYTDTESAEYVYGSSLRPTGGSAIAPTAAVYGSATHQYYEEKYSSQSEANVQLPPRLQVIVRLLESENEYVRRLTSLVSLFVHPIRAAIGKGSSTEILDDQNFQLIFVGIENILELNKRFMEELDRRFTESQDSSLPLGDVFLAYIPFFKMYSSYISTNDQRKEFIQRALGGSGVFSKRKYDKFANYVRSVQARADCDMTLREYLELPCNRITEYQRLLTELAQHTDSRNADKARIAQALVGLSQVNSQIEGNVKERKNVDVMRQLEKCFSGNPGFLKPGRFIIRQGPLVKKSRTIGGQDREYSFFLFNDLLAYALHSLGKFRLHAKIDIDASFKVRVLPVTNGEHRFLICSSVKTFVVIARDAQTRDAWVKSMVECIAEVSASIPESQRRVAPALAPLPIWLDLKDIPDAESLFPNSAPSDDFGDAGAGVASAAVSRQQVLHKLHNVTKTVTASGVVDISQRLQQLQVEPVQASRRPPPAAAGGGGARFCPLCGTARIAGGAFCSQCGNRF